MVIVLLPRQLRGFAEGKFSVEMSGKDLLSVVKNLVIKYPDLYPYLLNEVGALNSFVNFYKNGKDIRFLNNQGLIDHDTIEIIPATAGG